MEECRKRDCRKKKVKWSRSTQRESIYVRVWCGGQKAAKTRLKQRNQKERNKAQRERKV